MILSFAFNPIVSFTDKEVDATISAEIVANILWFIDSMANV